MLVDETARFELGVICLSVDQAYQKQPCLIFIDQLDGLASVRDSRAAHEYTSVVTTLLGLMDGIDDRGQVYVIGATNRIDQVDSALRRPGRFDCELFFPLPDFSV